MPEGDTIHAAALRVGAAVTGSPLVGLHVPRLPRGRRPAPGLPVGDVEARGKYLLVHFQDDLTLLTHLRMAGSWRVRRRDGRLPRARAVVEVEDAYAVCARAPVVQLLDAAALRRHRELRALGPDLTAPDPDLDEAVARMGRTVVRGTAIGDALLDQRPACGIGNVVMQETCFLVGIDPRTPVELVDVPVRSELYATASRILQHNVHTSRRTTVPGAAPGSLYVYDRTDRPCRRCGAAVAFGRPLRDARPTWWCPACQPPATTAA